MSTLRSFLREMKERNEVLTIKEKFSPRFQIPAIIQKFDGGPILLFKKVQGYKNRIVANVCGTRKRICHALKTSNGDIYSKLFEAWEKPLKPKIVDDAPVKEVVEKPNLHKIPVLTHFEKDGGAYITSAVISAKSPDGEIENVSIHRLQIIDETHLAIRLVPRHLFKLWSLAKQKDVDLDVSISIGVHPAIALAASSPLPFGTSEFAVANTLLDNNLRLVQCEHINANAVADAEIVMEGKISTQEQTLEGPLVDVTGTYDVQRKQPIIKILRIMHKEEYIYQALLPSGSEHRLLMGLPREALIWRSVSNVVPIVKAVNLSNGGCGWLHAIISIEKQTEGDGKNAILAAFSAHPSLKHVIVVDSDINIYEPNEVEWAIATRFQANEDLVIIQKARGSTLDPSANQENGLTTKMGIDATRPLTKPKGKFEKARIPMDPETERFLQQFKT
jgi:UbiD family decarboxylase